MPFKIMFMRRTNQKRKLIKDFDEMLRAIINDEVVYKYYDINNFNPNTFKIRLIIPPTAKSKLIIPVINIQGRAIPVPITVSSESEQKLKDFLQIIASASNYARYAKDIMDSFMEAKRRKQLIIGDIKVLPIQRDLSAGNVCLSSLSPTNNSLLLPASPGLFRRD